MALHWLGHGIFAANLDQMRTLMLLDHYEHIAAIYLAGMAKAEHRDAVPSFEGQGMDFADGLRLAKVITLDECSVCCSACSTGRRSDVTVSCRDEPA
ncbi:hypothetical protein ACIPZ8_14670 [Pseudomonas sp. NPDC089422]|uniref:hypothetical protein n=1 Tax=Pseudomonas sp. NPDC089422 TaxID=3364466 RepID=UPI00381A6041